MFLNARKNKNNLSRSNYMVGLGHAPNNLDKLHVANSNHKKYMLTY
jgi:hypothetical protein